MTPGRPAWGPRAVPSTAPFRSRLEVAVAQRWPEEARAELTTKAVQEALAQIKKPRERVKMSEKLEAETGKYTLTGSPVTFWRSDSYAEDWYSDALVEARSGGDHNARRREIIFACCFAETFIFEWTQKSVKKIKSIDDYFPPERRKNDLRYRRDLKKKWKEVPKELYQAGEIGVNPTLELSRFGDLLRYRHGLIHASGSRPQPATDAQPSKTNAFPTKGDMKKLRAGWAVSIVFDLVSELCDQLGEPKPNYLQKP